MEWELLRTFEAVARLGSLTAASKALGVSQSTISRHLARLEERAGSPLLLRDAPQRLTERGASLLAAVRPMVDAALVGAVPDRIARLVSAPAVEPASGSCGCWKKEGPCPRKGPRTRCRSGRRTRCSSWRAHHLFPLEPRRGGRDDHVRNWIPGLGVEHRSENHPDTGDLLHRLPAWVIQTSSNRAPVIPRRCIASLMLSETMRAISHPQGRKIRRLQPVWERFSSRTRKSIARSSLELRLPASSN